MRTGYGTIAGDRLHEKSGYFTASPWSVACVQTLDGALLAEAEYLIRDEAQLTQNGIRVLT